MSSATAIVVPSNVKSRMDLRRMLGKLWPLLPFLTFVLIIFTWWLAVRAFDIPRYLLPAPQEVVPRIFESHGILWSNGLVTLQEIFLGFGLTVVTAIPIGLLIALSRVARQSVYPLLVFLQLVPKIAIAPLFLVWVGFGMESKVLLTVLMTFFPLLLASIAGFQILDQRLLYLQVHGCEWVADISFPSLPRRAAGDLRRAQDLGDHRRNRSVVAEFVGANKGLGYLLLQATGTLDTTLIFAILLVLTFIGMALNYIVEIAEYFLAPWQRARRND